MTRCGHARPNFAVSRSLESESAHRRTHRGGTEDFKAKIVGISNNALQRIRCKPWIEDHHLKDQSTMCFLKLPTVRNLLGFVTAILLPTLGSAQEVKRAPLADYVSFCFALWEIAPEVQAKAKTLGLDDATGAAAASITVGRSTMRFFRSPQANQTVNSTSTEFKDGKDFSCDINLPGAGERAELEVMEKALDLDGQIMTLGPTSMGRWKIRNRQPVVLLKAIIPKASTILMVQKLEAMPVTARAKQNR
jgi:hypothetical protein